MGFWLYIIFMISWFLHLPSRVDLLGVIRFDFLLIGFILIYYFFIFEKNKTTVVKNTCYKRIIYLILMIIIITPFSEWPGSAIKYGFPNYIKSIVFFFFTVWFVQTEIQLKILIKVFLGCQIFRIVEPLYLHLTEGYWGSRASLGNWDFMNRLSGAPSDVINPNGLAFVVLMVTPFLFHYLELNKIYRLFSITIIPISFYVIYLTGSRSGILGMFLVIFIFLMQSKRKILLISFAIVVTILILPKMDNVYKDRYLSIVAENTLNAGTAEGRIRGIQDDFAVGLRKPIVGHGLGTSREANANFGTRNQISHNIYTEIFQELGILGLIMFMLFVFSVFNNIIKTDLKDKHLILIQKSLILFGIMNLFFGLASYGFSSNEWYLIAGLSVVLSNLGENNGEEKKDSISRPLAGWWNTNFYAVRL